MRTSIYIQSGSRHNSIISILVIDWSIAEVFNKPGLGLGVIGEVRVQSCDVSLLTLVYNDGLDRICVFVCEERIVKK